MNKIEISEIENILGFEVDQIVKTNLDKFDLSFNYLSQEERDSFILDCINFILNDYVKVGAHRKDVWENGWNENYVNYNKSGDYNDLIPKYFGKSDILRWKGDFIKANTTLFDYKITSLMVDANQKRVGQLGPTEKVGPKSAVGKLVGANESVGLSEMDKSQPSSDRGGESSGDPYAKGGKGTPIKADKAKKDFAKILQKNIDKSNKAKHDTDKKVAQHMKEGQDDLDAILRIIRK